MFIIINKNDFICYFTQNIFATFNCDNVNVLYSQIKRIGFYDTRDKLPLLRKDCLYRIYDSHQLPLTSKSRMVFM
jgi:hypothetical protein